MASDSEGRKDKFSRTKGNLVPLVCKLIEESLDKHKCEKVIFWFEDGIDIEVEQDYVSGLKIRHIRRSVNEYSELSDALAYFVADKYDLEYSSEEGGIYSTSLYNYEQAKEKAEKIIKARREFLDHTYSQAFKRLWDEHSEVTKKLENLVKGEQTQNP